MADEGILQSMFPPAPLIEEDAKFDVSNFLEHNVQLPRPKAEQLLQRMKTFYENRLFCDLTFVCGNVDMGYNSVPCHSLVIVSALPELYNLCEIASNLQTENDISRIFLPEFTHHEMKSFIDSVYQAMVSNSDVVISHSLVETLGLRPNPGSNMIMMDFYKSKPKLKLTIKRQVEDEIGENVPSAIIQETNRKSFKKARNISDQAEEITVESDFYHDDFNDSIELPQILEESEESKIESPKKKHKRSPLEVRRIPKRPIVQPAQNGMVLIF